MVLKKNDAEPLVPGDTIEIVHLNGNVRSVTFDGLFGNKFNIPYIRWGAAGQYRVNFETGQLIPRKASVWRLTDTAMLRLRATQAAMARDFKERQKVNK